MHRLPGQWERGAKGNHRMHSSRRAATIAATHLALPIACVASAGLVFALSAGAAHSNWARMATAVAAFITVAAAVAFVVPRLATRRDAASVDAPVRNLEALVESDRRALAALFTASAMHEVNNLLTVLQAGLILVRDEEDRLSVDARESLADMEDALRREGAIAKRLTGTCGESSEQALEAMDLVAVVADALAAIGAYRRTRDCLIRFEPEMSVRLVGYPALIHQLVTNLVLNAADAVGGRGRIDVHLRREGELVVLEVHDEGPGIPPERRPTLFEPFCTTKSGGAGLGLASVAACAQIHGGRVEVGDSPRGGACFKVYLAAAGDQRAEGGALADCG